MLSAVPYVDSMPTPTQELADRLLGRPLAEYVAEMRSARPRWPWRLISRQLAADTDGQVNVSHEALRGWYPDEAAA